MGKVVRYKCPSSEFVTEPHLYEIRNQRLYEIPIPGKPWWYQPVLAETEAHFGSVQADG